MGNLMILAFLCGSAVFPCWLLKKRFEQVFGFALMASVLVVFIAGFFGYMMEAVYGLFGWAVLSSLMVLWMSRKELKQLFSLLITPGTIVLAVCYLVMYITFDERLLYEWDEIAFWGPFARETYRLGEFYNSANSVVDVHLSYPPASTLFEYIFVLLLNHFHEPHLLLAIHTICLSMMLPCLGNIRLSDIHIWAPLGLLAFLLPGIVFPSYYGNIYPDALLGLCMAYAMYQVFLLERSDMFGFINLAVTTSFLLLIKDLGLIFALVVMGTVTIKICFFGGKFWQNPDVKFREKTLAGGGLAVAVLVPLVFYSMWSIRVTGMGSQFDKTNLFSLQEVMDLIGGRAPEYRYQILSSYGDRVFSSASSNAPVAFSYMGWMALLFAIMIVMIMLRYKKGERKSGHWVNICMLAGGLLYALGMLILYLFRFGEYSGLKLASYNRYMNTYMLAYIAFTFMCGSTMFTEKKLDKPYLRLASILPGAAALGITLAFLLPTAFTDRVFMKENIAEHELMIARENLSKVADNIRYKINLKEDKVFFVIQNTRGFEFFSLRFELLPLQTNGNYEWSIGEKYPPDKNGIEDNWTWEINRDDFARILEEQEYDYVFLQKVDEGFTEQFGDLFIDRDDIGNRRLFRVLQGKGGAELEYFDKEQEE